MRYDAIIIGGGAAGLFCAITAGRRGKRVLVIEHNAEVGRKIVISGGGRCNFTNTETGPENFISRNPHFCKSALARFTPRDFVRLVREHKISFYEKKLGQLFCRESSRQIVDMLLTEAWRARVDLKTACPVKAVSAGDGFTVNTSAGPFGAANLVVACGGLSFPKIGATGLGYDIARQFGIEVAEMRPSLVAMVLEEKSYSKLAGVSLDTSVSAGGQTFRENTLFTHRGLSGPAILQVSNYWERGLPVQIDCLPGRNMAETIHSARRDKRNVGNFLSGLLPARFVEAIIPAAVAGKRVAELSNIEIDTIARSINSWQVSFSGTEGYGRAEVTLGGVSTGELSSQTMEAKKVPGLYFIGEVVDVTGWLGGYNFQWAWASGYAAGNSL